MFAEQSSQTVFIEYDYVIYDLAFAGSDPALGSPVLPRAPVRRSFGRDAERSDRPRHVVWKDRVVVEDQVAGA